MPGIQQLIDGVLAIQRGLDVAGHAAWFVRQNVDTVLTALHLFLFATVNPFQPGQAFTSVGPVQEFTPLVQAAADLALLAALTWAFTQSITP